MTVIEGRFEQPRPARAEPPGSELLADRLNLCLDAARLTEDARVVLAELEEARWLEDETRVAVAAEALRVLELIASVLPYKDPCPF